MWVYNQKMRQNLRIPAYTSWYLDLVVLNNSLALVPAVHMLALLSTQVSERGGKCVPVICDSTNDGDIEKLFERIKTEESGRLDLLVNNAYAGVQVGGISVLFHISQCNLFWNARRLPCIELFRTMGQFS